MKIRTSLFVGITALCGVLPSAGAATVSWTDGAIAGDSTIIAPTGSLSVVSAVKFAASNAGGVLPSSFVLNTVTFNTAFIGNPTYFANDTASASFGGLSYDFTRVWGSNDIPSGNTAYNALTANMKDLLFGGIVGQNDTTKSTLTIGGLTAGMAYTVEIFSQENEKGNQDVIWTSGGQSVEAAQGAGGGLNTLGSYFVATFTADSSTQEFDFSATNSLPSINGIEVLESVPEPSTIALLSAAVGLMGLAGARRFRFA
jgi:hypothetical protein